MNMKSKKSISKHLEKVEIIVSAIIENMSGEILVVKSPKWHNKWTFPGGHVEPGEKMQHSLSREIKEETGLEIKSINLVSFGELINSKDFCRPAHFVYFDFWCTSNSNLIKLDKNELNNYKWVNPRKALKMNLAESFDKSITEYLKFKVKSCNSLRK